MEDARILISVRRYRRRVEIFLFFSARRFVRDSHALCFGVTGHVGWWQGLTAFRENVYLVIFLIKALTRTMMDHGGFSANANFCRFCDAFLTGKGSDGITTVTATVSELDSIAKDLALNESLRHVPPHSWSSC